MQLKLQSVATVLKNSYIDLIGMDPVLHHTAMDGLVGMLLASRSTSVNRVHFLIRNTQLSKLTIHKRVLLVIRILSCPLSTTTVYVVSAIPTIISLVMRHLCYNF